MYNYDVEDRTALARINSLFSQTVFCLVRNTFQWYSRDSKNNSIPAPIEYEERARKIVLSYGALAPIAAELLGHGLHAGRFEYAAQELESIHRNGYDWGYDFNSLPPPSRISDSIWYLDNSLSSAQARRV